MQWQEQLRNVSVVRQVCHRQSQLSHLLLCCRDACPGLALSLAVELLRIALALRFCIAIEIRFEGSLNIRMDILERSAILRRVVIRKYKAGKGRNVDLLAEGYRGIYGYRSLLKDDKRCAVRRCGEFSGNGVCIVLGDAYGMLAGV